MRNNYDISHEKLSVFDRLRKYSIWNSRTCNIKTQEEINVSKTEAGFRQRSCDKLLDTKTRSISRILERHLDEYDKEIKDLVMSGRTSDRYLELPVGKR